MRVYTHEQVIKKIRAWTDTFPTFADACRACGCTKGEMSLAVNDKAKSISHKILKAVGVERATLYVADLPEKYKKDEL